jgi:hypothetical protein
MKHRPINVFHTSITEMFIEPVSFKYVTGGFYEFLGIQVGLHGRQLPFVLLVNLCAKELINVSR